MDANIGNCSLKQVADVFVNLDDDISREIYMLRLRYLLDGNEDSFRENIIFMLQQTAVQCPMLRGRNIVFYGLSNRAKWLTPDVYGVIEDINHCKAVAFVDKFADNSPRIDKCSSFNGLPIISPAELNSSYRYAIVVTSSPMYRTEIIESLLVAGFPPDQISSFDDNELLFGKPYFNEDIIGHCDDEILIDCGVYDGMSIHDFSEYTKFKKVIGFEPDSIQAEKIKHNLIKWHINNVDIITKGTWSHDAMMSFVSATGQTSHLEVNDETLRNTYKDDLSQEEERFRNNKKIDVPVTTIDCVVGEEKVTLIKMDIEGSELESLKGAANTITRNKPRMAISIYHKPEDIVDIPLYIKSLVPNYKFYIRQYHHSTTETVLYAVVNDDESAY